VQRCVTPKSRVTARYCCFPCFYNCASEAIVGYNWPSRKSLIASLTASCPTMLTDIYSNSKMTYDVKISFFYLWPLWSVVWSELTDFSYSDFTVSYRDALDRLRVRLNIVLLLPCQTLKRFGGGEQQVAIFRQTPPSFRQRTLWVLKILILSLNSAKMRDF